MDGTQALQERIATRVDVVESGCWMWRLRKDRGGYGRIQVEGQARLAHRISYEAFVGTIPGGLPLDHLCHSSDQSCVGGPTCPHRSCVNPAHLEPVTPRENCERSVGFNGSKTHCSRNHPYDEANTYIVPRYGFRRCRECQRMWSAERYRQQKAVSA